MSSTRSKLQLDEQSFQGLLAAAYTIQEHADLLKSVTRTGLEIEPQAKVPKFCQHCAAELQECRCSHCGWEESRPPERMQNMLPSLERLAPEDLEVSVKAQALPDTGFTEKSRRSREICGPNQDALQLKGGGDTDPPGVEDSGRSRAVDSLLEAVNLEGSPKVTLLELRERFDHHRADLYLGLSVLVAILALFWPSAASPQKPRLDPWQRVLVQLGIAEAPPPQIHYQGDPNIQVWVDPHTALYYCAGDEQYGKAVGGHVSSQRDAQTDQFEPANRAACN
jgi:hypothetical protein